MKKIKVTIEYEFEVKETTSDEVIEEVVDCLEDFGNVIVCNTSDYYDIFDYEETYKILSDMNRSKSIIEEI